MKTMILMICAALPHLGWSQNIDETPAPKNYRLQCWGEITVALGETRYRDGSLALAYRNVLISGEFARVRGEPIPQGLLQTVLLFPFIWPDYTKEYGTSNFAVGAIGYHLRMYYAAQLGIGRSLTEELHSRQVESFFGLWSSTEYFVKSEKYLSVPVVLRCGVQFDYVGLHLKAHIQTNPEIKERSYIGFSVGVGFFKNGRERTPDL